MAYKVAAATGAWSAAATWNSVTNTPTLHASTNVTINATARFTAGFTAPNLVNACTGVLLFINAIGTGGTVTVTLQESTVDTAATVTLNITDLVALTWVYFRFATPYVFTTTGADAYRFKVQAASPVGTINAAADSGASLYAFLATDNRTGVPGSTDDIWICGQNQVTAITVTLDGTQTIGSKTDTVLAVQRTLGNAISLNNLGVLAWDQSADSTLTCGGNILCNNNGGELQMGTVASPMPAARLARLRFDMAATGNHGLRVFTTGKLTLQGTPKSSTALWKAKLVSGVGTAASPLVVDAAVDWSVGDEITIGSTDTYDQNETRFIITKNSTTSYVLSATSGGAEAAFTYTHTTDAWAVNVQRNVLIDSTNSARAFYINVGTTTVANVDIDWTRFDVIGTNTASKTGLLITGSNVTATCDYSIFSRHHNALQVETTRLALTFTGNVSITQSGAIGSFIVNSSGNNKTFIDCFAFTNKRMAFDVQNSFNVSYTRCISIGGNQDNTTDPAGFRFQAAGKITGIDCEVHCGRAQGMRLAGATDIQFSGYLSGTKGTNTTDILIASDSYATGAFINSSFGSATLISNYLNLIIGSEIAFHAYNGNNNNHTWYTNTGAARSSGSGLVDTTTRTVGSLAVRIAPEDVTTGFFWEFLIGVSANSAASVFGFIQKNAAFGTDVVTVELFLPGSTVADASQTMGNTTGTWLVFNLAASYTGSVAAFARVRITAKTITAGAYIYIADLYNGTNVLTSFKAWSEGKPAPVFTELLGDAAAVWAILDATQTTVGTMGYGLSQLFDLIDVALSTRASQASVDVIDDLVDELETRLSAARAGYLDNLNIGGDVASSAQVTALNNLSAAQIWDLANGIETGVTPRQAFRLALAALAGLLSGAATTQITIKNAVVGDKNRIVATVDSDGNRTAITYDVS